MTARHTRGPWRAPQQEGCPPPNHGVGRDDPRPTSERRNGIRNGEHEQIAEGTDASMLMV